MYVSNRSNSYKVIRVYKKTKEVKLQNKYGATFIMPQCVLDDFGYKEVKEKPRSFT